MQNQMQKALLHNRFSSENYTKKSAVNTGG